MNLAQQIENPLVRPIIEYRAPTKVFGHCSCGCMTLITDEYSYILWEDQYFTDRSCLIKYMIKHCGLEEVG